MTQSTRVSTLVLVSSRFKRTFSCAYAYACVVRLNQPSMLFFFSCLNALRACVYIYIQLLSYFRAPTLWFIDVTIATCHVRYTFLSLCQFFSRENGQNTKILRMIRKLPPTVTRRAKHWYCFSYKPINQFFYSSSCFARLTPAVICPIRFLTARLIWHDYSFSCLAQQVWDLKNMRSPLTTISSDSAINRSAVYQLEVLLYCCSPQFFWSAVSSIWR